MKIVSAAAAGLLLYHRPDSSQPLSLEMRELIALQDATVCFSSEFSTFENVYLEYADIPTHYEPQVGIYLSPHSVTVDPEFLSPMLVNRLVKICAWQRRHGVIVLQVDSPPEAIAAAKQIKHAIGAVVEQFSCRSAVISESVECLAGIAAAGGIFDPQRSNPFSEISINLATWTVMWRADGFLHTEGESNRSRQEFEASLEAAGATLVGSPPNGYGNWNSYQHASFESIYQEIRALI